MRKMLWLPLVILLLAACVTPPPEARSMCLRAADFNGPIVQVILEPGGEVISLLALDEEGGRLGFFNGPSDPTQMPDGTFSVGVEGVDAVVTLVGPDGRVITTNPCGPGEAFDLQVSGG